MKTGLCWSPYGPLHTIASLSGHSPTSHRNPRQVKRLSALLLGLAISGPAAAQTTGYGPLALTLPSSARTLGMGDIGVVGRDDDVIFYNPAQLIVSRGTSFSLARLSKTARGGEMSTGLRLGTGAIGFGVNYLEYQVAPLSYPPERRDIIAGNSALGTSVLGAIGYARTYKGFRLGATAKYAMDAVDIERFGQAYGDAGIARDFSSGKYTAGLAVQHIGMALDRGSDRIQPPTTATLGAATSQQLGPFDAIATAGVSWSEQDDVSGGGGAEVSWSWLSGYSIAARLGGHTHRLGDDNTIMGGLGFTADRMTFDIAAEQLAGNRVGYRAGIRIR
jgi:hypothetical protein